MFILFFVLWILLNGRITAELVILGLVIAGIMTAFSVKVIGYSPANDRRIGRRLPWFLLYALNLVREILKAAWICMGCVLRAVEPDPVIVEFHSGLESELQNVLLANSITLTPGTITVFQEKDHFVVHCLRREFAEGMEESSFVRLLRRFS